MRHLLLCALTALAVLPACDDDGCKGVAWCDGNRAMYCPSTGKEGIPIGSGSGDARMRFDCDQAGATCVEYSDYDTDYATCIYEDKPCLANSFCDGNDLVYCAQKHVTSERVTCDLRCVYDTVDAHCEN